MPALGEDVVPDAITATSADGVLSVTMPVVERAEPRRVVVERAGRPRRVTTSSSQEISS